MDHRKIAGLILLLISIASVSEISAIVRAGDERDYSYSVLIDLSHGQNISGLDILVKEIYDGSVYILLSNESQASMLPASVKILSTLLFGDLSGFRTSDGRIMTLTDLGVDLIIIPQISPGYVFTDSELEALRNYLSQGSKALWIAGTGDYGDGESVINEVNKVLGYINSSLALDYVSIEDPVRNAGAPYRLIATVSPSSDLLFLTFGVEDILMYRPGVIAYRDVSKDLWHPLDQQILANHSDIKIIAVSSPDSIITEYKLPPEGIGGRAYKSGEKGSYPLIAAQILSDLNNSIVVVSGSSPVGGGVPIIASSYYGSRFDGPRFIRNMILWLTGSMGELKYVVRSNQMLQNTVSNITALINSIGSTLSNSLSLMNDTIERLSSDVNMYSQKINDAVSRSENLSAAVAKISLDLGDLRRAVSDYYNYTIAGILIGSIALVLSVVLHFIRRRS
ncbi:MAG: hypothetical protein QXJ51_02440 [Sulfolobales archaeon]